MATDNTHASCDANKVARVIGIAHAAPDSVTTAWPDPFPVFVNAGSIWLLLAAKVIRMFESATMTQSNSTVTTEMLSLWSPGSFR